MKVVDRFKFHWVSKEVVVDEGLHGWVVEEVFVVNNETVVRNGCPHSGSMQSVGQCVEASCCGSGARSVQ